MFTGLVEHIGTVSAVLPFDISDSGGNGFSMTISNAAPILPDCHIGDSIAVNGVCLTVTEFDPHAGSFKVGLSPETLSRSSLATLKVGHGVNLERAMGADTRFGGHFVQGHVDATVSLISRVPDGNSLRLLFKLRDDPHSSPLLPYIIPKGYITLDGASLTITSLSDHDQTFGVMLVAHTQSKITLATKQLGDLVNVEVDMIGKYVERSIISSLNSLDTDSPSPFQAALERMVEKVLANKSSNPLV